MQANFASGRLFASSSSLKNPELLPPLLTMETMCMMGQNRQIQWGGDFPSAFKKALPPSLPMHFALPTEGEGGGGGGGRGNTGTRSPHFLPAEKPPSSLIKPASALPSGEELSNWAGTAPFLHCTFHLPPWGRGSGACHLGIDISLKRELTAACSFGRGLYLCLLVIYRRLFTHCT